METIIILLMILVPIVFRLVGRKLEQAAHSTAGQQDMVEQQTVYASSVREDSDDCKSLDVEKKAVAKIERSYEEPVLKEEKDRKERIDPKKLVIYSEIMRPKYME